jgi:hypothetical protein
MIPVGNPEGAMEWLLRLVKVQIDSTRSFGGSPKGKIAYARDTEQFVDFTDDYKLARG